MKDLTKVLRGCFNLEEIFDLLQGVRNKDFSVTLDKGPAAFEEHGVLSFREFFESVLEMSHIQKIQEEKNNFFELKFAKKIYSKFKNTIRYALWEDHSLAILNQWFPDLKRERLKVMRFALLTEQFTLKPKYYFLFSDGTTFSGHLEEPLLLQSFYVDQKVGFVWLFASFLARFWSF